MLTLGVGVNDSIACSRANQGHIVLKIERNTHIGPISTRMDLQIPWHDVVHRQCEKNLCKWGKAERKLDITLHWWTAPQAKEHYA